MNENTFNIYVQLMDLKEQIEASIKYIDSMVQSSTTKYNKTAKYNSLIDLYDKTPNKELFVNNLKKIFNNLIAIETILNSDINNINNISNKKMLSLYVIPQTGYDSQALDEEFVSFFQTIIVKHKNVSAKNNIIIDLIVRNDLDIEKYEENKVKKIDKK